MGQQLSCGITIGDHSFFWAVEYDIEQSTGCCESVLPIESFCGSDAFYRDAFTDADYDVRRRHSITSKLREQAMLKSMKTEVFLKTVASTRSSGRKGTLEVEGSGNHQYLLQRQGSKSSKASNGSAGFSQHCGLLGTTLEEYIGDGLRAPIQGPCWKKGDGLGIPLRDGPNYLKNKPTMKSKGHMYDVISMDGFRPTNGIKIDEIIGRVIPSVPPPRRGSTWTHDCPLPRVLCINIMLPYYNPKNPWATDDGGCSWVVFCEIEESTLQALRGDDPVPPWIRLFQKFCDGPVGRPGGDKNDKNRSLNSRRGSSTKDRDTGIFRAVGWCENEDELGIPDFLRKFNGQSFVITESGYIIKDPKGEWLEMGFDVRMFPILFKEVLYKFGDLVPKGQYHGGFLIQATEDEYLPEGLICDLFISGIDLRATPVEIEYDPN